jgi:hypothetical protein
LKIITFANKWCKPYYNFCYRRYAVLRRPVQHGVNHIKISAIADELQGRSYQEKGVNHIKISAIADELQGRSYQEKGVNHIKISAIADVS